MSARRIIRTRYLPTREHPHEALDAVEGAGPVYLDRGPDGLVRGVAVFSDRWEDEPTRPDARLSMAELVEGGGRRG